MGEVMIHKGGCCCGSIRYQVLGDPVIVAHCHCEDCQRISGAGHSTGAMYPLTALELTGETRAYQLKSDTGSTVSKIFCPQCGSPIYGTNNHNPDFVTVSLGTLDDSSDFKPAVAIYCRNKKSWDHLDEDVQQFDSQPNWKPE